MLIGDKDFWKFWKKSNDKLDRTKARKLLSDLMDIAQMPDELSGDLSETQWLVSRFTVDLPPHHSFWRELAKVVSLAFPKNSLSQAGSLERKIHQFRYVISSQQAQYVRTYYGKSGRTDAQALAYYLKERKIFSYFLFEPARLHNKIALLNGVKIYPSGQESYNIKVLMTRFCTEFILSSDGHFLNEVDAESVTEQGIVNGASFNYGFLNRHWDLDVRPVSVHDPAFRKRIAKKYKNPKKSKKSFFGKIPADYDFSYFNKNGLYAKDGRSHFQWVRAASKNFSKQIKAANLEDLDRKSE